jgi:predicted lipoprotein with Yx(FWY)xxD motif
MKPLSIVLLIVLIVLVGAVIWWFYGGSNQIQYSTGTPGYTSTTTNSGSGTPAATSTTQTTPSTTAATVLSLKTNATLGAYLTAASNDMTLYRYTKDTQGSGVSTCYGQCAAIWPPYTVKAPSSVVGMTLSGGTGTIGTITRTDGTIQVTYNGWPLYFYAPDKKPGDTTGQNVGGVWFVVKP